MANVFLTMSSTLLRPAGRLLLAAGLLIAPAAQAEFTGKVVAVLDGDTLDVARGGRILRLRLAGVDAPEPQQRYGPEAREKLAELALNRTVSVEEQGLGREGFTLASVRRGGRDLGLSLLRAGLAWRLPGPHPDEMQRAEAEATARRQRIGLWRDLNPLPPWEWRQLQARVGRER